MCVYMCVCVNLFFVKWDPSKWQCDQWVFLNALSVATTGLLMQEKISVPVNKPSLEAPWSRWWPVASADDASAAAQTVFPEAKQVCISHHITLQQKKIIIEKQMPPPKKETTITTKKNKKKKKELKMGFSFSSFFIQSFHWSDIRLILQLSC